MVESELLSRIEALERENAELRARCNAAAPSFSLVASERLTGLEAVAARASEVTLAHLPTLEDQSSAAAAEKMDKALAALQTALVGLWKTESGG